MAISQRILLLGGLLLFLLSAGYGLLYDGYVRTDEQQSSQYNLDMALNMATKGDLTGANAFARQFGVESARRETRARIPWHLAIVGAMTIVPFWLAAKLAVSERMKRILALFIVSGGLLLVSGDFIQLTVYSRNGYYLVLVGYGWLAVGLAGFLLYAGLNYWQHLDEEERTY